MSSTVHIAHILSLIVVFCFCVTAVVEVQDLGGNNWKAEGSDPLSDTVTYVHHATVPGCIHTDWYNHVGRTRENNPFYRFNDIQWRSISEKDWIYRRNFATNQSILKRKEQLVVCDGLDTIANITVNGQIVGITNNMFVRHFFNVTGLLQDQFNEITVSFMSAIQYVNKTRKSLKYPIPPECPPDVQHGFCHKNLIRKEQCSFSWDWGPGFPTQGIWKPMYLLGFDKAVMTDVALSYAWDSQVMNVEVRYRISEGGKGSSAAIHIYIDELSISSVAHILLDGVAQSTTVTQEIPKKLLKYWWPSGQGKPKLYNVTVTFEMEDSLCFSSKTVWFGFRKVELVQESVNGSSGLSFYFKINDRAVFMKGSNWIPADAFPSRVTKDNYTNLLQSAKDANMNILRVWGGGIYENDQFYDVADQLGIMIWHDFMFACAMYPSDSQFLKSVSEEVVDAIWRLKSHPSIILWAGNNENEAALATDWYNTTGNFELYRKDYVSLYVDTIRKNVTVLDKSRPFLASSPTNGIESQAENWVAKNPYDTHYGDTHYYNYDADCMDWTTYPRTRFASEYGFQSFSSVETLSRVTIAADLSWTSDFSLHRNHHSNGNSQILNQILKHFKPNATKVGREKFEDEVYLSQIMQALCYKSQTEFYRRSRSEILNGEGHTMGALYWQLNDVWQTISWSSIEYGGKWKAAHYYAKKFFANVALSAYSDDTVLTVYSLSDSNSPIEPVTLLVEMHSWGFFGVLHSWETAVSITPQSSKLLYQNSTGTLLHYGGCDRKELCYFIIYVKEIKDIAPTFFYPVPLKTISGLRKSNIVVVKVEKQDITSSEFYRQEFSVSLSATAPAFFVWLEAIGIQGRFSDNAFNFYTPTMTVMFYALEETTSGDLKSALHIKSLADAVDADQVKEPKLGTDHEFPPSVKPDLRSITQNHSDDVHLIWLDDVEAQLAFGICGILFLLFFAIMLVCVIMRFNSPHLDKPKLLFPSGTRRPSSLMAPFLYDQDLYTRESDKDDSSGAFMLNLKNGYGNSLKNIEIRFYVR